MNVNTDLVSTSRLIGWFSSIRATLRCGYPELKLKTEVLSEKYGRPRILIEEAGVGFGLIKELKKAGHNTFAITPKGWKEQRLARVSPIVESERVYIPETTTWLGDFEAELASFLAGRHDDQVDAITQFLIWASEKQRAFGDVKPIRVTHC